MDHAHHHAHEEEGQGAVSQILDLIVQQHEQTQRQADSTPESCPHLQDSLSALHLPGLCQAIKKEGCKADDSRIPAQILFGMCNMTQVTEDAPGQHPPAMSGHNRTSTGAATSAVQQPNAPPVHATSGHGPVDSGLWNRDQCNIRGLLGSSACQLTCKYTHNRNA